MANRTNINSNDIDWRPASEIFPGYVLDDNTDGAGVFIRVLRRPDDGAGCWHCLLRFRPPNGKAIRVVAIAESDEEAFILNTGRSGLYSCNPAGLRHGQTVSEDTVVLVHYHGDPDRILRIETVELVDAS